ncbi:ABC transporter [Leucobacter sp. OLIS6]|uniref:ABC-F family ATP-binding cassette domain-containing protein n=1 Tax=unclassified Leucobacter TaxID=2621730 RepID=UPI000C18A27B|nr:MULTISPECIES: ATP-binding cassette domain-containing protein [unclassified Leucobacter]PII82975.1 ABC transporter [Leucobacter sp. OLCALW19]PII91640.1 ABC transporter [Leucobacter sp. OLTLW20]PII91774.1 ABC transporter [Leucobacter sp. OLAS13]PII98007.1 ABC transporter [Leucobacter sp. OLCS4]PIJ00096.1 ABC transporter [Leucobacter sp. OLDS2]
MAHLDLSGISYGLPDGRPLLNDVSLRVGAGQRVALIGANGAGKSTLLRIALGELEPDEGAVARSGGLGVMRQFITGSSVRELLLGVSSPRVREAADRVDRAERNMLEKGTETSQMTYANALAAWGEAGGYDAEVFWDVCTTAALGIPYDRAAARPIETLSGGEQKRLVLEALLRGPDELIVLDEPDNFLDVPGKRWLEDQLRASDKSVLFVSHDRELLARSATAIATLELGALGSTAWIHPGSFASYHAAREARFARLDELRKRWDEDHAKLRALVLMYKEKAAYNSDMTSRYRAAQTRLARFEAAGPPHEQPREQRLDMRLAGGRTGKRAVVCEQLELTNLMFPFDAEAWYGDRIAVLGANGSGKSHFLRLLAAGGTDPDLEHEPVGDLPIEPVAHEGLARLGARVRPGWFAQTQRRPDLAGRTLLEILHRGDEHRAGRDREAAARALARYELAQAAEQTFESLSGGQQARFQILLLELGGATLLLLDEPTDHLDLESAEALQQALGAFDGTVIAVTHDRWFARDFDRFWVFQEDGEVVESPVAVWDEGRVVRER